MVKIFCCCVSIESATILDFKIDLMMNCMSQTFLNFRSVSFARDTSNFIRLVMHIPHIFNKGTKKKAHFDFFFNFFKGTLCCVSSLRMFSMSVYLMKPLLVCLLSARYSFEECAATILCDSPLLESGGSFLARNKF